MVICPVCFSVYDNKRIPVLCCLQKTLFPGEEIDYEDIPKSVVEEIEQLVGMGNGAWDCVDGREIIAAVLTRVITKSFEE